MQISREGENLVVKGPPGHPTISLRVGMYDRERLKTFFKAVRLCAEGKVQERPEGGVVEGGAAEEELPPGWREAIHGR